MRTITRFLRRFLILLIVFVMGVAGTAFLMNNETTDDRSDMNNPTLPEVMVDFNGTLANRMYGYRQPMEADFVRDRDQFRSFDESGVFSSDLAGYQ